MYTHLVIGSNDIERSKRFYDAVFTALGGQAAAEASDTRLAYRHNGGALIVKTPLNGEPATASNGATIGLAAASTDMVDAWHAAGVENGGVSVEDPPGLRENPSMRYYAAYLRDPDGHKICAICVQA